MASKPVFVIVPGAWHLPETFEPTSTILAGKGYESKGVQYVSSSDPSIQSFDPDVQRVRTAVQELLAEGKDVVLVMHSYGGVVGSEAMKYFLDDNEGKDGKGKIVRMVWVTAFVMPTGMSLMDGLGGKDLPWFMVEGDTVNPQDPKNIFYNDMTEAEAERYIKLLKPHAYRTFYSKVSVEPWQKIPSTYILCENDNAIPITAQEGMVAAARNNVPSSFDVIERCTASHTPFASTSQPEKLAGFLIKAAGGP